MALALLTASACKTIPEMAPPVDGPVAQVAESEGYEPASLKRGRDLYLGPCIDCHTVEPIDRYSRSEWDRIVREMAPESNLSEEETADLHDYVMAAHRALLNKAKAEHGGRLPPHMR